jgi:hypothetical protein
LKKCTLLGLAILLAGCGHDDGGRSSNSRASTASPVQSTTSPVSPPATAPVSVPQAVGAQLAADAQARSAAYLTHSAGGNGYYAVISQLSTGATSVPRAPLEGLMDFVDSRADTADFKATALVRLVYLHGSNPAIPTDLRGRAARTLQNFKYWIDEPGQDEMIFWSENHQILFASCEFLAGQLYPTHVFSNSGLTGDQHKAKARARILRWIDHRLRFGFSEWYSPVYYPHDTAPLLNLVDFANDPEIQEKAAMALDLLLFDMARLTTQSGSFANTAGRIYEEHKWDGHHQSVADLIEILWGTRGTWRSKGSTAGTPLATSTRYTIPYALLAVGVDKQRARFVDRSRVGISFADAGQEGIGFQSKEDGLFWWGMGAYVADRSIVLTRRMIRDWDLWHYGIFDPFQRTRSVPDFLLPPLSATLAPFTEGSFLSTANTYCFRTPDAQLSSVQSYRRGQVGFQQHAWQATLDLDAVVWTTSPAPLGRSGPGEWTGSASLPQVTQHENVALILYNPGVAQRLAFPAMSHAWFPRQAFDEIVELRGWTCGRKGQGYVALYSAQPTQWVNQGAYAGKELQAGGYRNAWICVVGREAEDGSFLDFVDTVARASVSATGQGNAPLNDPLEVVFDAPGVGQFKAAWGQRTTLAGTVLNPQNFQRFDNPYAQQQWGDPHLEIRHAGLSLRHDRTSGTRRGDGL